MPSSEVLQDNGILEITPAATNPKITERGMWNIFRVCGRDDQQGGMAGAIIADKYKGKRVAIVHDKTTYGQGLAEETRKALHAKGMKEVMFEGVNKDDKDFTALVSKLKAANPDLVYWGGLHDTGGIILRQMRDQGLRAPLMGGDGLADDEFAAIAGPGAEGTLMTFSPDPRKNPAAAEVVARFKEKGIEPEGYVLYTYAAIQAWKEAAEKAGSTDAAAVVKALNENEFDTVIGKFKFNEKGDPNLPPYAVYRWSDGAYEEIGDEAPPPAG
jgi:branched-chain amino acid transport system substrate-binding protein